VPTSLALIGEFSPSASPDEMVVKVYPLKYETTDLCASLE
jgi:hypothetical protein